MNAKQLKSLLTEDVDVMEDLILAKINLKAIDAECQAISIQTPDWVIDKLSLVSAEITKRNRVELQRRLKTAKARREAIATPDEKRRSLESEIEQLEKALG